MTELHLTHSTDELPAQREPPPISIRSVPRLSRLNQRVLKYAVSWYVATLDIDVQSGEVLTNEAQVDCLAILKVMSGPRVLQRSCPFCTKVFKTRSPLHKHLLYGCAERRGIELVN